MQNRNGKWARLKKSHYYSIVGFLIVILLFSIVALISIFVFDYNNICSMTLSLKSVFMKGVFIQTAINSMYYIRRIYKKSISKEIEFVDEYNDSSSIGVILYFGTRPIFGILFYLIASVLFINFVNSIISDLSSVNGSLNHWIVLLGIYVGYTTGNIIDLFSDKSNRIFRASN